MREAPTRTIVAELTCCGAEVFVFDPVAGHEAARVMGDNSRLAFAEDMMNMLEGADALLIATEWSVFRSPGFAAIKDTLKQPLIFDGRNMYDPAQVRAAGLRYFAIGR